MREKSRGGLWKAKEAYLGRRTRGEERIPVQSPNGEHLGVSGGEEPTGLAPGGWKQEETQICIDALPDFLEPIFRGVHEHTGLHAMVILGGPMPKYSGELWTVNFAVGRTRAAAPIPCTLWKKDRFNQQVVKFMMDYLATAFDETDCDAAAVRDSKLDGASPDDKEADFDDDLSLESSDDESDSGSSGEDEEEEEDARLTKKRKTVKKPACSVPKGTSPAPPPNDNHHASLDDLPYDQQRQRNMRQNKLEDGEGEEDCNRNSSQPSASASSACETAPRRASSAVEPLRAKHSGTVGGRLEGCGDAWAGGQEGSAGGGVDSCDVGGKDVEMPVAGGEEGSAGGGVDGAGGSVDRAEGGVDGREHDEVATAVCAAEANAGAPQ
ncbi:hypothetical protein B0H16DRAFT_1796443 [Mycena metata]|uniref:Uncharacterized protein n=1 Tax=Mycena metata TaxID=1033252 RepID=A0AAD7JKE0_9AGAR|nr:hypothetical protein B0H16DRAFT_1796443 [Mycena metata]